MKGENKEGVHPGHTDPSKQGGACQLGSGRSGWAEPSGTPITENRTRQSGDTVPQHPVVMGQLGGTILHTTSQRPFQAWPHLVMKTGRLSVAASTQLDSSTGTHSRVTTSAVFGVELHFPRGCGPYVHPRDRQLGLTDAAVCSLPTWEPPRLS